MTPLQYSMTNDTVTVFIKGEPHSVTKDSPNYPSLRKAIIEQNWDAIPKLLTVAGAVESWAEKASQPDPAASAPQGMIKVEGEQVTYNGKPLPLALNDRILKTVAKGEDAEGLINLWKRLQRNPNPRSVDQLWGFLAHSGIPVQPDGTFLAYKGVRIDFRDAHSNKFDNSPGKTIKMNRDKISTDPTQTCHVGLHVGALSYARSFAAQCIIVRVDPEHVCCVPNDYNASKMRVCEYTVMGLYGGRMPDTSFKADAPVKVAAPTPIVEPVAPRVIEERDLPLTGTPWDNFNGLDLQDLLAQNLNDLRKYARYNCLVTGASKLPGGKEVLVDRIIQARRTPRPPRPPETVVVVNVEPPKLVAPVEETAPLANNQKTAVSIPLTGTEWDRLNGLNSLQLLDESLDSLRKYAAHNCLIVGASKLPGGKLTLVTCICQARGDTTTTKA